MPECLTRTKKRARIDIFADDSGLKQKLFNNIQPISVGI